MHYTIHVLATPIADTPGFLAHQNTTRIPWHLDFPLIRLHQVSLIKQPIVIRLGALDRHIILIPAA